MAPACRLACNFCAFFWSKCFKGTFHLKFFPPNFLGPLFAGMLNSCMSACAVWLHAFSCSFSLQQCAFSCMFRPSSRPVSPCAVRCAPVSTPSRLPCPFSPASPCAVPSALRRAVCAVLALALARVRLRQPSAVCASVPAVRQPSAHQAAPVMPAVRLRQIKVAPVMYMAGPPMHKGSASYGLTASQLKGRRPVADECRPSFSSKV